MLCYCCVLTDVDETAKESEGEDGVGERWNDEFFLDELAAVDVELEHDEFVVFEGDEHFVFLRVGLIERDVDDSVGDERGARGERVAVDVVEAGVGEHEEIASEGECFDDIDLG